LKSFIDYQPVDKSVGKLWIIPLDKKAVEKAGIRWKRSTKFSTLCQQA